MEVSFLSARELQQRYPSATKAFRPPGGRHPYAFVATKTEAVVGDVGNHLALALAAWPPFPVDLTSYLLRAVSLDTRTQVVGLVRPHVVVGGLLDVQGIVRSCECPSVGVFFSEQDTPHETVLYLNDLRAALYDFFAERRRAHLSP